MPRYTKKTQEIARRAHDIRHRWHSSDFDGEHYQALINKLNLLASHTGSSRPQLHSISREDLEDFNLAVRKYIARFLPGSVVRDRKFL